MTISGADIACTLFDACNTRLRVLRHIGADDELQYASSAFLLYLSNTAYLAADSTAKDDAFPETYMVHPPSCATKKKPPLLEMLEQTPTIVYTHFIVF